MAIVQELLQRFTYLGILAALLLGSLGVPIPEEMPIVAAGILSHQGSPDGGSRCRSACSGCCPGDVVLYLAGRRWGERLLGWRVVRHVLTRARAERLKAAYREHAMKTVAMARHVTGLRAAAFLTAGIARVPFWKFIPLADAAAAAVKLVPLASGWPTSSPTRSAPSWPTCTAWSGGWRSPDWSRWPAPWSSTRRGETAAFRRPASRVGAAPRRRHCPYCVTESAGPGIHDLQWSPRQPVPRPARRALPPGAPAPSG